MPQSKTQSLKETVISTFIGLAVSLITQIIVFPLYNMEISFNQNIQITQNPSYTRYLIINH